MKKNSIAYSTMGLILLTFISKILGFLREMVVSYMYGASEMSDAYSMANSVIVLIVAGFASGIMTAYIPNYMGISEKREQNKFTCNVLNITAIWGGIIGSIFLFFAESVISVLGMGFTESTKQYTVILFRFVVAASVCMIIIYIMNGYLNICGIFSYGGLQLIITNLIIIVAVLTSERSPWKLGIGYIAAYIVPLLLGMVLLKRHRLNYTWEFDFKNTRLKQLYFASAVAFLGTNIVKIDVMIDRVFASSLQEGTVAAMNYAFTLISICPEVFIMPIVTVAYPRLSELFVMEKRKEFGNYIREMLVSTIMILLPVMAIFLGMGRWIIQILFQRGAFNWTDTLRTTDILKGYSYGILGIGVSFVLCKVFFSRREERIPVICLGVGIGINVFLNCILGQKGGNYLAWTTSLSVTISVVLMLIILVKKCPDINMKEAAISVTKILMSVLPMSGIIFIGMKACVALEQCGIIIKIFTMGSIALIALAIYVVLLCVLHVKEILFVLQRKQKEKS